MQNTKKLLAILFSISVLLLILGCSTGSSSTAATTPTTTPTDSTPPKIVSVAAYAGTNILVTFNENIALTRASKDLTVFTVAADGAETPNIVKQVSTIGKVLSITVTDTLRKDEKVKVTIGPNVIKDSTGNVIAGTTTPAEHATVVIDDVAPTVFTVLAIADFTGIIPVPFSEEIAVTDATGITVQMGTSTATLENKPIDKVEIYIKDSTQLVITLVDKSPFAIGQLIKVAFAADNTVTDIAKNKLPAITPATVAVAETPATVAVADLTAPRISSVKATAGTKIVSVVFSEAIAATTDKTGITVSTGDSSSNTNTDNPVVSVALDGTDAENKTLTITVTDNLTLSQHVLVTFVAGHTITDRAASPNKLADNDSKTIQVTPDATVATDNLAPTVLTVAAAAGSNTITVQFSEEIAVPDATGITVKIGDTATPSTASAIQKVEQPADNHSQLIITLTATAPFAIGQFIKVEFAANNTVTDKAGNQLVAIMPATVAVADLTTPIMNSVTAAEGAKFVSVVFNEAIAATTDKTGITVSTGTTATGGTENVVVSVALDSTDTENKTLTITVTDDLTLDDYVVVTFAAGHTITDRAASPNKFENTSVIKQVVAAVATALTTNAGFELWIPSSLTSPTTITEDATITYNNGTTKSAVGFDGIYVSAVEPTGLLSSKTTNIALTANTTVGTAELTFAVVGTTNPVIASTIKATARVIPANILAAKYYFFGNALDHNGIFYPGYENTQTYDISGDTSNNSQVMKITDTNTKEWAAGGYQMPNYVDISRYTHLVVVARKTADVAKTAELSILLKFSKKDDGTARDLGPITKISDYNNSGAKIDTPLTTTFKTYKIPVATLAGNFATAELRDFNLVFPYDTTKTAYEVEIQAIYFE